MLAAVASEKATRQQETSENRQDDQCVQAAEVDLFQYHPSHNFWLS